MAWQASSLRIQHRRQRDDVWSHRCAAGPLGVEGDNSLALPLPPFAPTKPATVTADLGRQVQKRIPEIKTVNHHGVTEKKDIKKNRG